MLTPAEIGENDVRRARGFLGAPLNLLVSVVYAGGIVVVALTLYASVVARVREFGIMKAVGAGNRRLGAEVMLAWRAVGDGGGRSRPGRGEAVVPDVLASKAGIGLGAASRSARPPASSSATGG